MGFFFRKSASVGPFRLSFSKSGIGASVGVKGARLTLTPRGTTYITVGNHGFYYRETLSRRGDVSGFRPGPLPTQPQFTSSEDAIATAGSSHLVDSSSERLIEQLNERAKLLNPAWIFYMAAIMPLIGLAILPHVPSPPNLPEPAEPLSSELTSNGIDEYAALSGRYGEPDSISYSDVDPLVPVPVRTAQYSSAKVKVVFVPNGCVSTYGQVMSIRTDRSRNAASVKRAMKGVYQCHPSSDSGWTTIAYIDSIDNSPISADATTRRLEAIPTKLVAAPNVKTGNATGKTPYLASRSAGLQRTTEPKMKSNYESTVAAAKARQDIRDAEALTRVYTIALLSAALGLALAGGVAHRKNSEKRLSRLVYELDEAAQENYIVVQQSLGSLSTCERIWRIESESSTSDWKRNAGASSLVRRKTVSFSKQSPPRVHTNVQVPRIDIGSAQLYFLPDTILYRDAGGYGAIAYTDFRVAQGYTRFIESDVVPTDATIVDHTWRYVNKNGGPDRRFNGNRQLPVLRLGVLTLTSSQGFNIQLNTSNPQQSLAFAQKWHSQFTSVGPDEQRSRYKPPNREAALCSSLASNRKILGVNDNASEAEVSAAYHRLAQMYHPDKVAGLAPEFQALADKRMTEINAAYKALKQRG